MRKNFLISNKWAKFTSICIFIIIILKLRLFKINLKINIQITILKTDSYSLFVDDLENWFGDDDVISEGFDDFIMVWWITYVVAIYSYS